MANVIVGPLVQNLVSLLQKEFKLNWGVEKDVEKLTGTLSIIQAVLEDAEAKQVKNKSIAVWLNKLKDAAYDAEDALDLWLTTTRQRELELTDAGSSEQVSCSISTCLDFFNEIIFRHKIAKILKEIIRKIDVIAEQKSKFNLTGSTVPQTEYIETWSILSEPKIYGRDDDKKNIIDGLLSNENQEDLSVFPLLGFGGVGKTTLAQLVYNDERVVGGFEARGWVCVSEPFDVKRILKAIIESWETRERGREDRRTLESLQSIQITVQELLKDKKYLLVLDDVWNENENEWNKLRSCIKIGAKGSSVVVTTRSPRVASITATITPYRVGVLSDDDCWSLLKHRALGDKDEEQYPNLVSIGKDIMKRCKGVPLAAKSLGSLLRSKPEENHWKNVRDSEIWTLEREDDILPTLRLSYNHLPSNLKQCFSYCSIFPKDHKINKTNLIYLWIANGFIQPKEKMELEEIGDDIFNELLHWSFLQDIKKEKYRDGIIETCKMHDLMHDLASSIAKNDCQIVKVDERTNVSERIRHLTVDLESEQSSTALNPPFLRSVPSLRTLSFLGSPNVDGFVFPRTLRVLDISGTRMKALPPSVLHLKQLRYLNLSGNKLKSLPESICRLVNLQMLDLSENREFESLPSSIGKLEHLRYLNLFYTNISSLPDSICRLRNLWWLDLSYNQEITILPQSIGKLTNLRLLNLSVCSSLESLPETVCDLMKLQSLLLNYCNNNELPKNMKNMRSLIRLDICRQLRKLPAGIGELRNLQTLGRFPVAVAVGDDDSDSDIRDGCGSGAAGINELHGLDQLRGYLEIEGLENVRNAEEARMANLRSKQYLTRLELEWRYNEDGSVQAISNKKKSQEVLQGLLPLPPNLQELNIYGYGAEEFPPQIFQGEGKGGGVLNTTLQDLQILFCPKLKSLPAEIGDLKALKSLKIMVCKELVSLPQEVQKLTSLTTLSIIECNRIKCLPTIGGGVGSENNNSLLDSLEISGCKNLASVSEGLRYLTSLKQLKLRDCGELELELGTPGFEHLVSLETLRLNHLPKLTALPQGIRHLRELEIGRCPELAIEEEKDLRNLVSLETLRLIDLTALPQGIRHLPMLQKLHIRKCENLRTLPDWLKHLTTLQTLEIYGCHRDLKKRCKRDEGEDWHKISHIPDILIHCHSRYFD